VQKQRYEKRGWIKSKGGGRKSKVERKSQTVKERERNNTEGEEKGKKRRFRGGPFRIEKRERTL